MELNYCPVIGSGEFQGHVVHKVLIEEILKGGEAQRRFMQKTAQYDAAVDTEEEGGVNLLDQDEDLAHNVDFPIIKPDGAECAVEEPQATGHFPPLPTGQSKDSVDADSNLSTTLQGMSIASDTASDTTSSTLVGSPQSQPVKAWGAGSTSKKLFPDAKATPAPSIWSVEEHDRSLEKQQGINILTTHFWDPASKDWNPDRFYDSVLSKYFCPFVCEQSFSIPEDLNRHIMDDHRVRKMKCPTCLKYFDSVYRWVAHCESRGSKCPINKSDDFGAFLNKATGGFLSLDEKIRPDHLHNHSKMIHDPETGRMQKFRPYQAKYLQYFATKPPGFEEKTAEFTRIGGGPQRKLHYHY